eukprot:361803-Chlamydomonas_euryale.AAC.5
MVQGPLRLALGAALRQHAGTRGVRPRSAGGAAGIAEGAQRAALRRRAERVGVYAAALWHLGRLAAGGTHARACVGLHNGWAVGRVGVRAHAWRSCRVGWWVDAHAERVWVHGAMPWLFRACVVGRQARRRMRACVLGRQVSTCMHAGQVRACVHACVRARAHVRVLRGSVL